MTASGNRIKTIAKNTLFLYFRMLLLMIISIFTGRVILEALGVEDYGIYNVVGGFVGLFAVVSASLTSANSRFLNIEIGKGNRERMNIVFSSCVNVQIILTLIVAVLCETLGLWYVNSVMVVPLERLDAARWCFHLSVINFCSKLLTVPYNAAIIAHEKMKAFAYVSLFEGVAKLGICYLLFINPFDRLVFFAVLVLVVQLTVRLLYSTYCLKHFVECHYRFRWDKELFKQIFSYSGWHLVGNTAGILKNHGVNVVLNLFFGPSVNAARGVANHLRNAVKGFSSNFITAIRPQIMQSYARDERDYMLKLVFSGTRLSFFMLFFLSFPVIVNADYLMHLWLKEVPEYAVIFCRLSFVLVLIESFSNTLMTAQNATGNVRNYQIVVGGISLLNVPVCYLCLRVGMEPYGVLFVAIILECVCLAARLRMITVEQFDSIKYVKQVVLKCLVVALISAVVPLTLYFLVPENLCTFLVNCVLCLLCEGISIMLIGCSKEERIYIFDKIRRRI